MAKGFKQLGRRLRGISPQQPPPQPSPGVPGEGEEPPILEWFPNPSPARPYEIQFVFTEFTSVCPVTGQPDFGTITVRYVPNRRCVEMKSLKLYFFAYRNRGIFYESVVNTILDDLTAVLRPREMTVTGAFTVRGGTSATVTARWDEKADAKK